MRNSLVVVTACWAALVLVVLTAATGHAADKNAKAAASEPADVTVHKDIAYAPGGGPAHLLDLYLPASAASGKAVPLVVFIHGGGWHSGSKDGCPAKFLASYGYAVASINYRFLQDAVFPAQIEDCRAALRFLRSGAAKYHLQPDHVAVWGGSAGGHLAALLGTSAAVDFSAKPVAATAGGKVDESVRVQCVIDMYGPVDFPRTLTDPQKKDKFGKRFFGPSADEAELMKKLRWASPITYVNRDTPPFLIQHGDADTTVPLEQSREMADVLHKAGVEATLMVMPKARHAGGAFFTEENHKTLVAFLDRHLKQTGAAPGR